jgi:Zn-dependent peptidase ImmA (M78 family)/DNA-binding XRE family transcriptional regulator
MARTVKALINPELLVWARKTAHIDVARAAKAAKISVSTLESWEAGDDYPSIAKLRQLAKLYKRPLSVFYLPEKPLDFAPLKDFRRLPGEVAGVLSPALAMQITAAEERRDLALELYTELGEEPPVLELRATINEDVDAVAARLRNWLGISLTEQHAWRDDRSGYNGWRQRIEDLGVLVFQLTGVGVKEARGFAIAKRPLPAVAVNGRDAYSARSFSLIHELCHVLLGESSISDFSEANAGENRLPDAERIEVFCNAVAAATLLPREAILSHALVRDHAGGTWTDEDLQELARAFAVSEEAVVRRLLTLGKASNAFYKEKRKAYEALAAELAGKKRGGRASPSQKALGRLGTGYARVILQAYYRQRLTLADVSAYLNVKLPWVSKIESAAYGSSAA